MPRHIISESPLLNQCYIIHYLGNGARHKLDYDMLLKVVCAPLIAGEFQLTVGSDINKTHLLKNLLVQHKY